MQNAFTCISMIILTRVCVCVCCTSRDSLPVCLSVRSFVCVCVYVSVFMPWKQSRTKQDVSCIYHFWFSARVCVCKLLLLNFCSSTDVYVTGRTHFVQARLWIRDLRVSVTRGRERRREVASSQVMELLVCVCVCKYCWLRYACIAFHVKYIILCMFYGVQLLDMLWS